MKHFKWLLFVLCIYTKAFSQTETQLPNYTPPTPEAYELTKYGDVPINEHTGMVTSEIPLYTYKAGKLELPISLNYTGAGVTVNQLSTWTGINWTLNAGGVIARTVNDQPDEYVTQRMDVDDITELLNDVNIGSSTTQEDDKARYIDMIMKGTLLYKDKKPDVFNFSFPGYSGSFYLDKDFNPVLSKKDSQLKIEIGGADPNLGLRLRNSEQFCITTPDGVKYYFGGDGFTDKSHIVGIPFIYDENPIMWTTGYYLSDIIHPIKGHIQIQYNSGNTLETIYLNESQSISIKTSEDPLCPECYCYPEMSTSLNYSLGTPRRTGIRMSLQKYVSKITSTDNPNETIDFTTIKTKNNNNYKRILDKIKVIKSGTQKLEVDLNYISNGDIKTADRFFLTEVSLKKSPGFGSNLYSKYTMEYDNPLLLPSSFSYSQ
ncbi:MAG: hypothetical protein KBA33_10740, partial [Cloacibacterium sp.]|nr:hypothetical protein [Cloacibacterium sp.]